MRVTKNTGNGGLRELNFLATILNFDFESGDLQDLKRKLAQHSRWYWALINTLCGKGGPDFKTVANLTRAELRTQLEKLVSPNQKVGSLEASNTIDALLDVINNVEYKTEWCLDPVEYEYFQKDGPEFGFDFARKDTKDIYLDNSHPFLTSC